MVLLPLIMIRAASGGWVATGRHRRDRLRGPARIATCERPVPGGRDMGAVLGTSVCRLHFGREEVLGPLHAAFDRLAGMVRRAAVPGHRSPAIFGLHGIRLWNRTGAGALMHVNRALGAGIAPSSPARERRREPMTPPSASRAPAAYPGRMVILPWRRRRCGSPERPGLGEIAGPLRVPLMSASRKVV